MERTALFQERVALSPKDMNQLDKKTIDDILMEHLRQKLEGRCSIHGYVIPESLQLLSRSMGGLENGRYTGAILFHVHAQGKVLNPAYGEVIEAEVMKNVKKMGIYLDYKGAIRVLVPRDQHLGNDDFEQLEPGDRIRVELRKSRFQVKDPFILSVGAYQGRVEA
jgi:DNA-directed RNA polymerase subunit E'/Rpb7